MPIKQSVTLDEVIVILNRALDKDRGAISKLALDGKVMCNKDLANDETIQCGIKGPTEKLYNTIGLIGILNGLFGIDDEDNKTFFGAIQAKVDEEKGVILSFSRVDHRKIRRWMDAN